MNTYSHEFSCLEEAVFNCFCGNVCVAEFSSVGAELVSKNLFLYKQITPTAGAQDDEEGNVGVLTWVCPVRWSKQEPTKEEGEPNTSFASDGELADRIQTMKFKRPVPPPPLLTVHVQKDFNVK